MQPDPHAFSSIASGSPLTTRTLRSGCALIDASISVIAEANPWVSFPCGRVAIKASRKLRKSAFCCGRNAPRRTFFLVVMDLS